MALSFSRPDISSPASIADARFSTTRRGFDQDEVRALLRQVAAELGRLSEREKFLQHELRVAEERAVDPETALDEETVTRLLGEETLRVLQTARESAGQIKARAEESAARLLREASDEADRIRSEADADAARLRSDASADAEAELSLAKQQGREMVNEARAYRERVLAELGRRRDAARQQIEQLASGRDRLLQVFERARLVAVDVMSDLAPLGEPDEYVNLAPTTGPVPLMVPREHPVDTAEESSSEPAEEPVEEPAGEPVEEAAADVVDEPVGDAVADVIEEPAEESIEEPAPDRALEEPNDEPVGEPIEESIEEAVEEPAPDEPTDESIDEAVEAEVADVGEPESTDDVDTEVSRRGGDNVVSLFERLRAETAEGAGTDADDVPDADDAPEPVEPPVAGTDADDVPDADDAPEPVEPPVAGTDADDVPDADDAPAPVEPVDDAPESAETIFERRDAELVPVITAAARKLKRVLADEQNDVLDRIRQQGSVTTLDELVPERAAHAERYAEAVSGELLDAARAGARMLDPDAEPLGDADPALLEPVRALLADALVEPLRNRLDRAVADGTGADDELAKLVRAVYREWKTTHIDDELDDIVRLAHGVGAMAVVAPGTPMCWSVDPNGPACPDAEDNALAGAVPAGEAYPTGHRVAPAHPGCRCLIAPAGN